MILALTGTRTLHILLKKGFEKYMNIHNTNTGDSNIKWKIKELNFCDIVVVAGSIVVIFSSLYINTSRLFAGGLQQPFEPHSSHSRHKQVKEKLQCTCSKKHYSKRKHQNGGMISTSALQEPYLVSILKIILYLLLILCCVTETFVWEGISLIGIEEWASSLKYNHFIWKNGWILKVQICCCCSASINLPNTKYK